MYVGDISVSADKERRGEDRFRGCVSGLSGRTNFQEDKNHHTSFLRQGKAYGHPCMYVCMYACMHVVCLRVCACLFVFIYSVCKYKTYVCMYVCIHSYIHNSTTEKIIHLLFYCSIDFSRCINSRV